MNEEIKLKNKNEIALMQREQMKNLKICMENFKKLRAYIQNLEEENAYLLNIYRDLAHEINLIYIDYQLDNPEMLTEEENRDFFNYNFGIK